MTKEEKELRVYINDRFEGIVSSVDALMFAIGTTANMKGWHDEGVDLAYYKAAKLALIHSEVSECLEAVRKPELCSEHLMGVPLEHEEIADIIIRCLDYSFEQGIQISNIIVKKMLYNLSRGYRHGGKTV